APERHGPAKRQPRLGREIDRTQNGSKCHAPMVIRRGTRFALYGSAGALMAGIPAPVAAFLQGRRFIVAGVSRQPNQAANAVFRKLKAAGYEVFPVNPAASEVEGVRCYDTVRSVPGTIDGVVIATSPEVAATVVRQCVERGIRRVWLHRSFGGGSVADDAVQDCHAQGTDCIVGGCPLMFCEPVDFGHRCMRWWLQRRGRVPK